MTNPIKLLNRFFQARTEKNIRFADGPKPGTLGTVTSKPDKDGFHLAGFYPMPGALGRTVRLHEADHLHYSTPEAHRRRFTTEAKKAGLSEDNIFHADNGLEDAHIGFAAPWSERPMQVRRDACAVAMRELRECVRKFKSAITSAAIPSAMKDNARCSLFNCALRALPILNQNGMLLSERARVSANDLQRQASALVSIVASDGSAPDQRALIRIALLMRDGEHAKARFETVALLSPTPQPKLELPPLDLGECDPDFEEQEREINGCHGGDSPSSVPIYLVKPPLTAPCISGADSTPIEDTGSSGYRIARRALCAVGMGLPIASPFIRRNVPTPGGCIVFDASGSMHVDADKLRRVCRAAPAATVIYYCGGECSGERIGGFIVTYAQDGMRLDDSITLPNLCNGNVADEQAILFGLAEIKRQDTDKPLIFVSDLGFCGNTEASKRRALALIQDGQRHGTIEVIPSISHALARFEGGYYRNEEIPCTSNLTATARP